MDIYSIIHVYFCVTVVCVCLLLSGFGEFVVLNVRTVYGLAFNDFMGIVNIIIIIIIYLFQATRPIVKKRQEKADRNRQNTKTHSKHKGT